MGGGSASHFLRLDLELPFTYSMNENFPKFPLGTNPTRGISLSVKQLEVSLQIEYTSCGQQYDVQLERERRRKTSCLGSSGTLGVRCS